MMTRITAPLVLVLCTAGCFQGPSASQGPLRQWTVDEQPGSITILAWFGDEESPTELAIFRGPDMHESAGDYLRDAMVPLLKVNVQTLE